MARPARGGHHACVYACPRADIAARDRKARIDAKTYARKACANAQLGKGAACARQVYEAQMAEYRERGVR